MEKKLATFSGGTKTGMCIFYKTRIQNDLDR